MRDGRLFASCQDRLAVTLLTRYFDELNIGDRWTSAARTIEHTDLIVWKRLTEPEPQTPTSPGSNAHRALRRPAAPSLLVNAFAIGLGMPATRGPGTSPRRARRLGVNRKDANCKSDPVR